MIVRNVRIELRSNIDILHDNTLKCLDGTEIEHVEIIKYLGIIIDDRL